MINVEELVQGFDGDDPTGPNLADENAFAHIERLHMDSFNPAQLVSTGADADDAEWGEVVRLGEEFLASESKDLKVAAWITNASLRVAGFEGFAESLELLLGLMETHWEKLHPSIPARASVLDWLCDDYADEHACHALYQVSLTDVGHTYFEYREWQKKNESPDDSPQGTDKYSRNDEVPEDEEAGFGEGFLGTTRDWYVGLVATLERCSEVVAKLDAFSKERFPPEGETPPSFSRKIGASLRTLHVAASELLALKPAPVTIEPDESEFDEEEGGGGDSTAGPVTSVLKPRSAAEAMRAIATGVRYLRKDNPHAPGTYLVMRALRWGEILACGPEVDPLLLDPPETQLRVKLKKLYLQGEWEALLEEAERAMESSEGRGWIDLHHYAIAATEALGSEYASVTEALYSSLRGLLQDRPALVSMTLMDDSYTASARALEWLQSSGLLPAGQGAGGPHGRPARAPAPPRPQPAPEPPAPAAAEVPEPGPEAPAEPDPAPVAESDAGSDEGEEAPAGKVQPSKVGDRLKAMKNKGGGD